MTLTEDIRLKLQAEIDASKKSTYRNEHGQYATPPSLSHSLLKYAKNLVGDNDIKFFDPAFGTGSFYTAALNNFTNISGHAVEWDIDYYTAAKNIWSKNKELKIVNADFTSLEPSYKSNLVICNPPYSRHHHIDIGVKKRLKEEIRNRLSAEISGLSGLHIYFMLLSHSWIEENGLSIWLVPSEIVEVNYGKVIRNYLLNNVTLERIHFFEQQELQFSDALVSSCVIAFKKKKCTESHKVLITTGDFDNPSVSKYLSVKELKKLNKWSKHLLVNDSAEHVVSNTLGDLFTIKRGIATGDNNFFILDKEKAEKLEIPKIYLRNIVPSSRYLKDNIIELDDDGYLKTERKLVLLDIDLPMDIIKQKYSKLFDYLKYGEELGIHKKYLASRRSPWYSQEKRQPPAYFVRYMTREKSDKSSHMLFIKNNSDAVATNSYLMLYEKPKDPKLTVRPNLNIWNYFTQGISTDLYRYGRTYGGGLIKFEPKELLKIPLAANLAIL